MFEFVGMGRMFELALLFMFVFVAIGVLVATGIGVEMRFTFMLLLLTVLFAAPPQAIPSAPRAKTDVSAIFFIILY